MNQSPNVTIAHDYQCPWSWVAFFQAHRLRQDFPGIGQDWRGYELLPGEAASKIGLRPDPSQRFIDFAKREGILVPSMPPIVSTHAALVGAEYVKQTRQECFDAYNEAVYCALWEDHADISNLDIVARIAERAGLDGTSFAEELASGRYDDKVIPFSEAAYADGITHVTTFRFKGEQCAEAPYATIADLAGRHLAWYGVPK